MQRLLCGRLVASWTGIIGFGSDVASSPETAVSTPPSGAVTVSEAEPD